MTRATADCSKSSTDLLFDAALSLHTFHANFSLDVLARVMRLTAYPLSCLSCVRPLLGEKLFALGTYRNEMLLGMAETRGSTHSASKTDCAF